nr:putative amidohydrolase [uncultured bacterium]
MNPATVHHGIGGRGRIDIVDAQIHLGPDHGHDRLLTAMDALGVRTAVLDELWGRNASDHGTPCVELGDGIYRPLSPLALAAAQLHPGRFGFLQRITRRDPALASHVALLAATPGCVSLRVVVLDRAECALFAGGGYDELLSLAQEYGLPLSVLCRDAGALVGRAAGRFGRLRIVVDHCGWGRTQRHWDEVLALARHGNVWLKWSHAFRAFGRDGMQPAFEEALAAFGPRRVLWAGDVTHEESSATWSELLGFVLHNPALDDAGREWVLGRAAREALRWG